MKGGNYGWPTCLGFCHNPAFIDPIVDFTPVVTPTGIATVAPNIYFFGEWNTGNLVRLELSSNGSVVSMNQVYTQNGGIIAVEMKNDGKLYFTSPDGIYNYDVQQPVPGPASSSLVPVLIVGISATVLVVGAILYAAKRYRRKGRLNPITTT